MYTFLPQLTAAAFERGKANLAERRVQVKDQGLQTSIVESLSLPSQPPKIYIFPQQTVAANAHLGTFNPLICFHSYLKISQDQQPAIPLFFPSYPLITQIFPFKQTHECSFLAFAMLFFLSSMLGSLGLNKQQQFDDPPPVMKIQPVGSVQADAQYCIQALLMVVRLQTLLMGHRVSNFFLSPKKHILGLTLWQIWTKLQLPVKGITRTGNSTTVGFLHFLRQVQENQKLSSALFSLQIFQRTCRNLFFSFQFFSFSMRIQFSSSLISSSSFSTNLLNYYLLRACSSVSFF